MSEPFLTHLCKCHEVCVAVQGWCVHVSRQIQMQDIC